MLCQRIAKNVLDMTANTVIKLPTHLASTNVLKKVEGHLHSTMNATEVDYFSKQTKEWWNPNGSLKLLHSMNLIRIPLVRDGLVQFSESERTLLPLRDKKILDVGCGGGILSEGLARLGAQVTGIDASKDLIEVAQEHSNLDPKIINNKPTYYNTTVEEHLNNFSNHYDGVVASEVIEHVDNQDVFVKSCVQALKPGGRVFFTTPNRTRLSRCLVIYMSENLLNIVPRGAHQHEKFITPNELTFLLERNGCHMELTYGYVYNILTGKWSLTSFQQLGYVLQALKLEKPVQ